MRENIYFYFMHTHILFILSLVLLWFNNTSATSLGHQLVPKSGGGAVHKCIDKERQALLYFKAQLHDPNDCLSTWRPEEADCCKWSGVGCNNQTGHVTKLDLSNYSNEGGLVGEISFSLLNLTYLNHLDLSFNYFHGTIPEFICSMTHLTYLHLGWNQFTGTIPESIGTIPDSIGSLTNLTYLELGENNFNGIIPRSIGSLTKLNSLDLSDNSFYGTIPTEFGNLTNLEYLFLSNLRSCNLDWLSFLSNLKGLSMDGISLAKTNNWVNVIICLQKLSSSSFGGCDLSQVMLPYSSSVNSSLSLYSLSLNSNNLNSSMFRWLCPLFGNKLTILSLSGNKIDGKLSDFLNNLSGCTSATLQELDASSSQFTGSLSDEIRHFSSLNYLNLSYNQLDGTISDKLWQLPSLQWLYLSSKFSTLPQSVGPKHSPHLLKVWRIWVLQITSILRSVEKSYNSSHLKV